MMVMGALVLYTIFFRFFGFLLDTFLLTAFLLRVMEPLSWKKVLAGADGRCRWLLCYLPALARSPAPKRISGILKMDIFANAMMGFQVALQPMNLFLLFHRGSDRYAGGCSPRVGPGGAMSLLLPGHVSCLPGFCDHHAGGYLLRGHVRRVHDFHSGQHPRGGGFRRHLPGRISDGPQGPGRPCPWNCGLRLFYRGYALHYRVDVPGALLWPRWPCNLDPRNISA